VGVALYNKYGTTWEDWLAWENDVITKAVYYRLIYPDVDILKRYFPNVFQEMFETEDKDEGERESETSQRFENRLIFKTGGQQIDGGVLSAGWRKGRQRSLGVGLLLTPYSVKLACCMNIIRSRTNVLGSGRSAIDQGTPQRCKNLDRGATGQPGTPTSYAMPSANPGKNVPRGAPSSPRRVKNPSGSPYRTRNVFAIFYSLLPTPYV
jgi:hypothetical protein